MKKMYNVKGIKSRYCLMFTEDELRQIITALCITRIHFEDIEMPITDNLIKELTSIPF